MFQDEGRFGRINNPRRCWDPEGFRPSVPAQLVREFTYVFAAVSPCDGVMDSLILPEVNSQVITLIYLTLFNEKEKAGTNKNNQKQLRRLSNPRVKTNGVLIYSKPHVGGVLAKPTLTL